MSRQAHAEESHDDGQNGTLSHVTRQGKSGLRCLYLCVAGMAPLRGPATRKPPALPGDGYSLRRFPSRGAIAAQRDEADVTRECCVRTGRVGVSDAVGCESFDELTNGIAPAVCLRCGRSPGRVGHASRGILGSGAPRSSRGPSRHCPPQRYALSLGAESTFCGVCGAVYPSSVSLNAIHMRVYE